MKIIERKLYLDKIIGHLNHGMMLILVGQRRVGKSFLLRSVYNWLLEQKSDANILYINKELSENDEIVTYKDLLNKIEGQFPIGEENYLLIDEVQDINGYENALRSLYAEDRCQIIATGSNAYIFSSELSTRLSGRYIEIPVRSLSYAEFLTFHGLADNNEALNKYLRFGGLPGLANYNLEEEPKVKDYIQGVYNTIMMKDVIAREKIRNVKLIENLAKFIADNSGKLFSVKGIVDYLNSHGEKNTQSLISNYIEILKKALLIDSMSRYDIHGKKLFELIDKYYFNDQGIGNLLTSFNIRGRIEKVMEGVVRLHLLIQGFELTVGILRAGEVDFVATKGDTIIYLQVTYLLSSEETIKREFGNLWAIPNNYPKFVISMDPVSGDLPQYPGIRHLHLREFLNLNF